MQSVNLTQQIEIQRTPRVLQIEGIYDVPANQKSTFHLKADMRQDEQEWSLGLICGASGSGKSSLARKLYPEQMDREYEWGGNRSIVDCFPESMSVRDVIASLSAIGLSSPPTWLRPFRVLSTGEQFRATMARALAENRDTLVCIDEFTSVVDRTVAKVASHCIAKHVRKNGQQFVAVSCHKDIIDWLQPDWVFDTDSKLFAWRCVQQRPAIQLDIHRCRHEVWQMFRYHHYLSADINRASRCFLVRVDEKPVAFTAVLSFPHSVASGWREHRTVVLPDYQGVGIGNAISEYVAAMYVSTGKTYRSTTSHPSMIFHRMKSKKWVTTHRNKKNPAGSKMERANGLSNTRSTNRHVSSFQFVGPPNKRAAIAAGLLPA